MEKPIFGKKEIDKVSKKVEDLSEGEIKEIFS